MLEKRVVRGGGRLRPSRRPLPPPSWLRGEEPKTSHGGSGGGILGTPPYLAQNDPHDALIILSHISQVKNFR